MTQFEIDHQYCKCGKINDSREKGVLTSRFCTECRKKYGKEMHALSRKLKDAHRIASPVTGGDKVLFDKIVGKYKE